MAVHRSSQWITVPPVSIAWSVAFIGALEQLRDPSWWIQGHVSEEKSLKKFFFFVCDSFRWAKHWPWQRRRRWRSYHRSITLLRTFVRYVGECALTGLEREGEPTRKSGRRDLLKWPSFVCFLAALQDGGLLEISCFSSMVSSMVPLANASWPSHFAFPLWSTVFIFWWFVCFFRAPALIFKKNWTRNIKNKRHALTTYMNCYSVFLCFFFFLFAFQMLDVWLLNFLPTSSPHHIWYTADSVILSVNNNIDSTWATVVTVFSLTSVAYRRDGCACGQQSVLWGWA